MLIFGEELIGGICDWLLWSVLNVCLFVVLNILGFSFMGNVGEMIDYVFYMINMVLEKDVWMVSLFND